jgi:hypothetical protein
MWLNMVKCLQFHSTFSLIHRIKVVGDEISFQSLSIRLGKVIWKYEVWSIEEQQWMVNQIIWTHLVWILNLDTFAVTTFSSLYNVDIEEFSLRS